MFWAKKKASQIEWKVGGGYNLSSKHNSELVPSPYKTFSVDSTLTSWIGDLFMCHVTYIYPSKTMQSLYLFWIDTLRWCVDLYYGAIAGQLHHLGAIGRWLQKISIFFIWKQKQPSKENSIFTWYLHIKWRKCNQIYYWYATKKKISCFPNACHSQYVKQVPWNTLPDADPNKYSALFKRVESIKFVIQKYKLCISYT